MLLDQGRKLVILKNQVLDVESFLDYHPGGRFVIEQRIGFSIDLPFNGHHYSGMQSEQGANSGHQHSNEARQIAQSLVIGKYSDEPLINSSRPVNETDNNKIRVEPSNGWDDSSSYRIGRLIHVADCLSTQAFDGFSVWTPLDFNSILI